MKGLLKKTVAVIAIGCGIAVADTKLSGSGATFPQPLYERWVAEYQKAHPDVKIDYGGGGSGQGIKDITGKVVDFAGSDAPLSKAELTAAGGADALIEIPSCAGGVVPAYNLPNINAAVNFDGKSLADMYIGKITKWNDPRLVALNPGVSLPNLPVTPCYRTDGSGTNFVWTNYLALQSDDFKQSVGVGKQVQWPLGQGGKGTAGVAAIVAQNPGSIGYIEQNYADKNNIAYGLVKNKAGKFIKASPEAVSAAGEGSAKSLSGTILAANIWDDDGATAYPISSFTYLIVYKDLRSVKSAQQAQTVADFLWWATHAGQKLNADLDYAPLSPAVQAKVEAALATLTYKGAAIKAATAMAR